jgi:integrase
MLKNVTLLRATKNGKSTWRLLGVTGSELEPFQIFADSMQRKYPKRTRDNYCLHLAQFIDYLYEASAVLSNGRGEQKITRSLLEDIIEAYDEYLVYGPDSGNEIAQQVASSMPSPMNKRATSALKHAPIRKFLRMSERVHQQTLELIEAGVKQGAEDSTSLFQSTSLMAPPTPAQRKALLANSMLAGVVAGGPKLLQSAILPTVTPQVRYTEGRAFPFDKISEFIDELPNRRDKALHSLYAASGCRSHEGLQILFDDIDFVNGTVLLIDPAERPNHASYLYLSPGEREVLAWKGRTTAQTMLIEPFASRFFEELEAYLKTEYVPHGLHRFVFQYLDTRENRLGRPFLLSDPESRLEVFKKAAERSGINESVKGPHSFRHAYGTYLLNYFPRKNGEYGLPMVLVQQLMGHAEIKSTEKYARHDKDLYAAEVAHANLMVFGKGVPKSILELKKEALQSQLRKIEKLLIEENMETSSR